MLVARGLRKSYGAVVAVDGVDLEVPAGHITGLVGNNGAGKTTTIKLLAGILEPTAGTATVDGRPTAEAPTRRNVGYLPEDSPLYDDQTPLEYLAFFAAVYGLPRRAARERAAGLLRTLRLDPAFTTKPIGELSKGSARKVAIARALLHDPKVLVLDEPASGLDPATRAELDQAILGLRRAGKAVLLSAHNLSQVEALCDDILLMHGGRIVARGTLPQLRSQWGRTRYRLLAQSPFEGSRPSGALHAAEYGDLAAAEAALAAAHRAGAAVVGLESIPPGLDEILRRAAEG